VCDRLSDGSGKKVLTNDQLERTIERRYNAPTTDDIGVIVVGEQCESRDIVLETRNNSLKRIAETHQSYDAFQYSLIFWSGACSGDPSPQYLEGGKAPCHGERGSVSL